MYIEQPLELRIYSALFISDIGSEDAKRTLISLAKGEAGNDPEDELKENKDRARHPLGESL
jgi:hypothetical protein